MAFFHEKFTELKKTSRTNEPYIYIVVKLLQRAKKGLTETTNTTPVSPDDSEVSGNFKAVAAQKGHRRLRYTAVFLDKHLILCTCRQYLFILLLLLLRSHFSNKQLCRHYFLAVVHADTKSRQ